jgi:hypothetical protein
MSLEAWPLLLLSSSLRRIDRLVSEFSWNSWQVCVMRKWWHDSLYRIHASFSVQCPSTVSVSSCNYVNIQWLVWWFVTSLTVTVFISRIFQSMQYCVCVCVCFFIVAPLKFRVTYCNSDFLLPSFCCRIFWLQLVGCGYSEGKKCVLKVLYSGKHMKDPLMTADHEVWFIMRNFVVRVSHQWITNPKILMHVGSVLEGYNRNFKFIKLPSWCYLQWISSIQWLPAN